tara:strand:+ start:3935 stop:4942 length:1008 start_codon:yes stop_codon:yes gene_type:complete
MRKTFLILLLLTSLSACQDSNKELVTINGLTMGTSYSIKIMSNEIDKGTVHTNIENILTDINQIMSTYIEDSEITLFNQSRTTDLQTFSSDLYRVIKHSNKISTISGGAFDITVGPLVNIWGFGPVPYKRDIPSDSAIQSIKQHTGFEKLSFEEASHRISKSDPLVTIDLSGIAKGFAVDKVAQYLDGLDLTDYLVEIGGELIAKGTNAKQQAWQIGIEQANPLERSVQRIVSLENIAMATSGDYRNYFEKDGIRYSHTIDPVSGKPISHTLVAVTVLHSSAMHADALATAFMVSGPEKSLALADKINVALYMIIKTRTGFDERYNENFRAYLTN